MIEEKILRKEIEVYVKKELGHRKGDIVESR